MDNPATRFGQHLAHTEKKYRDRALKKLTVYLTRKKEWTELDWDKLWKALFYCMWMSDKRPVQEELSTNLSKLVHKLPTPQLAMEFVDSFFRTMHREWHGLDGLRLDKFYSLVRKFVNESVALLRVQDFDDELVEQFATILSQEIVSQLPNGLRMHLADVYLVEICNAAGKDVPTDAFVQLMEPFFTLLGSEYDKTVFKRVRELVFEAMVTDYKFGPQPEKEKVSKQDGESDETDDEEEQDKVFEQVELAQVQHRIFALASADDTAERNRSALYTLYKRFFTVTHVDSMQAAMEPKKEKKQKKAKKVEEPVVTEETEGESKKKKKSKKRKAKAEPEAEEAVKEPEEKVVAKKAEEAAASKKKAKKQKVEAKDVEMETPVEVKESKKQKKSKEEPAKEEKKSNKSKQKETETPATEAKKVAEKAAKKPVEKSAKEEKKAKEQPKQEKPKAEKKESYVTVTKSGKKFRRCGACGGFGKGLVPKDKSVCGHCERSHKTQKKKSAAASKKRKAETQAQAAREAQEKAEASKKVTFGKSKALRHEVSVKRLKASAKRDDISKDADGIKGVLKVSSPSPIATKKSKKKTKASKDRKTAADFF